MDVGKPVSVTVLGAACGDPAGAAVGLTANGSEVELAPRGDGLYTGSFTPTAAGAVQLVATATAAGASDTRTVSGTATSAPAIVPGGDPVTVTTTSPGEDARLVFEGAAGRRISLKLSDVTIGTSCCSSAKISILKPDGSTLLSASSFGTSGGFIDTKTLPQTGSYRILVDPQSNAVGSVTLTLYDVPEDAESPVVPGGAPASAETTAPGQNAAFLFDALAGDRVSLKLSDVTIGTSCCSSAKISILKPDGSTLLSASSFGTSGGFIDTKTLPQTGAYRILVDPQSNAVGSVTLTLYDVPEDAESPVVPGGAPASAETTAPGQNAAFLFDALAGDRVSLKLSDVTIGTSCCSSAKISILKPDGSTLLSASSFGTSGGFIDTKTLPQTGSYRILVDPQSNAVGSVTLTLYDVPDDPTGTLVLGGAASTLALDVPGQNGWRTFSGTAGRTVTLRLTAVTIGTSCCSSAKVSVLRPDGTTLVSPANFGTSGKTLSFSLPAHGRLLDLRRPAVQRGRQRHALGELGRVSPHVRARDGARGRAAEEAQGELDLRAQELQHAADAVLSVDGEPPEGGPADQHRLGSERERRDDVRPPAHPAVHEDEAAPRDSLHDLRKGIEARLRAVELAAAVIRDHDAVDAVLAGELRVLFREDPFHEEREGRDRAQPFQVAPGHRRIDDLAQRGVEVPASEVIREVGEGEVCGNLERGADVALPVVPPRGDRR